MLTEFFFSFDGNAAKDSRKLTFVFLANDVIQNSRKKGPEFGKEFGHILGAALKHMGHAMNDEKTRKSLERILSIWAERNIFDAEHIATFRKSIGRAWSVILKSAWLTLSWLSLKKKKTESTLNKRSENGGEPPAKISRHEPFSDVKENEPSEPVERLAKSRDRKKSESSEVVQFDEEGNKEVHVTLSPKLPAADPPEPEELIKALQEFENAASSDENVRERIAKMPSDISDASSVSRIQGTTKKNILFLTEVKIYHIWLYRPSPSWRSRHQSQRSLPAALRLQRQAFEGDGGPQEVDKDDARLHCSAERAAGPSWRPIAGTTTFESAVSYM